MKVTLTWLQQYVDFTGTPEELADRLTLLGLEVEGVQKLAGEFDGVVVGQVLSREKHPNADKLSVCRVADGRGERQIVCGASNFQVGDKVPLILPGSTLPPKSGDTQPFTIKVGKIRNIESQGMMCSAEELGIDPEATGHRREDGLLILRPDATVGQPLAAYLGRAGSDVVYDLEVTPNRPDLNSVIGIAREIAAVTGNPLRIPAPATSPAADPGVQPSPVSVRLEAPDLCPRYTARVIRGVRIGPSPDWLRQRLEQVGLRSINNVVDVTNYVMWETGQPLHAFDFNRLALDNGRPSVVVRRAVAGEKLVTLDGVERTLAEGQLLIADPEKALALAGVMGGRSTEIGTGTTDILLESAWFQPTGIRRTSKALGLRSDASYRFERGADIGGVAEASRRAAELIVATAGGVIEGGLVEAYPEPTPARQITLRYGKVGELVGIPFRPEQIDYHLHQLGLRPAVRKARSAETDAEPGPVAWVVPSWRVDLKREADLIEEVARLHGVDRIPSTVPRSAKGSHPYDAVYDVLMEARRLLTASGLHEAQGQTLVNDGLARSMGPAVALLANPLSADMNALRPSLLPGLIDTLRHNLSHRNGDVQLFEMGRVFVPAGDAVREGWRVALAMTGARNPGTWSGADREARCDVFDLKGVVEEFLERFGVRGVVWARRPEPTEFWLESATLALGGKQELGQIGVLSPALSRKHDLRDPVILAELNLDLLLARRNAARAFKPLPAFPASRRDVAMIVPEAVTHEAVLAVVRQAKLPHLESAELFDVFRGKHVAAGQKSVAYAFTYRAADRTLKDEEVQAAQIKLLAALKTGLGAVLRE